MNPALLASLGFPPATTYVLSNYASGSPDMSAAASPQLTHPMLFNPQHHQLPQHPQPQPLAFYQQQQAPIATNNGLDLTAAKSELAQLQQQEALKRLRPCPHPGCSRIFSRLDHLKLHLLGHSNARPFECQTCGRHYRQVYSLRRHHRNSGHTGIKRHQQSLEKAFDILSEKEETGKDEGGEDADHTEPSAGRKLAGAKTDLTSPASSTGVSPNASFSTTSVQSKSPSSLPTSQNAANIFSLLRAPPQSSLNMMHSASGSASPTMMSPTMMSPTMMSSNMLAAPQLSSSISTSLTPNINVGMLNQAQPTMANMNPQLALQQMLYQQSMMAMLAGVSKQS